MPMGDFSAIRPFFELELQHGSRNFQVVEVVKSTKTMVMMPKIFAEQAEGFSERPARLLPRRCQTSHP